MGHNEDALHNVRRKIAEVAKKEGNKIVVGWSPEEKIQYKEGDVWSDSDGKEWTIKHGIKQSISNLQSARTPMFCPSCEKVMSTWLDTKFWRLRGKCEDCTLKEETQIRLSGGWERYETISELKNQVAFVQDQIAEISSYREALTQPEIIHADDEKILMIEKWTVDLNKIRNDMTEDIDRLQIILDSTLAELDKCMISTFQPLRTSENGITQNET